MEAALGRTLDNRNNMRPTMRKSATLRIRRADLSPKVRPERCALGPWAGGGQQIDDEGSCNAQHLEAGFQA